MENWGCDDHQKTAERKNKMTEKNELSCIRVYGEWIDHFYYTNRWHISLCSRHRQTDQTVCYMHPRHAHKKNRYIFLKVIEYILFVVRSRVVQATMGGRCQCCTTSTSIITMDPRSRSSWKWLRKREVTVGRLRAHITYARVRQQQQT